MRAFARCPDEDDHRPVEEPDGDEALLAVILPVVLDGQRGARENFTGAGHVEASACEGGHAFRRVERDRHNLCYYDKQDSGKRAAPLLVQRVPDEVAGLIDNRMATFSGTGAAYETLQVAANRCFTSDVPPPRYWSKR